MPSCRKLFSGALAEVNRNVCVCVFSCIGGTARLIPAPRKKKRKQKHPSYTTPTLSGPAYLAMVFQQKHERSRPLISLECTVLFPGRFKGKAKTLSWLMSAKLEGAPMLSA